MTRFCSLVLGRGGKFWLVGHRRIWGNFQIYLTVCGCLFFVTLCEFFIFFAEIPKLTRWCFFFTVGIRLEIPKMQTVIACLCLSASLFLSRRTCVIEKKKIYWHHAFQFTKYIPKLNKLSIYIDRYKITHLLLMRTISQHAFLFFYFYFHIMLKY